MTGKLQKSVLVFSLCLAAAASADKKPIFSGFALLGGASQPQGAFIAEPVAAQLQMGIDWYPSPALGAHVHLVGRTDGGDSKHGVLGIAEAFVEGNLFSDTSRLRVRGGILFLPTSFENIDALWENPFTISSSALNTWLGEELRPVGVDTTYFNNGFMLGATIFRGNDTLGALPPVRGWALSNRWTLAGEKVPVNSRVFTSVSAETDSRLGWSARGGWTGRHLSLQYSYLDNRSDGLRYDDLYNWNTKFHIVGGGYHAGAWTFAAESLWGPTFLVVRGRQIVSDISATYFLMSRQFAHGRISFRGDVYNDGELQDEALTLTYMWTPTRELRAAAEVSTTGGTSQVRIQLRYRLKAR